MAQPMKKEDILKDIIKVQPKIYIVVYRYETLAFNGIISYYIVAKSLKEAKANIKQYFVGGNYWDSKVISLNKKHQFKAIFNATEK
jgi:hypothetical protein